VKIALLSSSVPTINGGYRFIVDWLAEVLRGEGHEVEAIYIPFEDAPESILDQMLCFRLMDLTASADRLITFRPPAHVVPHPRKVIWFIHHIRAFYDQWNTSYCPVPDTLPWRGVRAQLMHADEVGLREARAVFANSRTVQTRLRDFNAVESEVLYPPVLHPERFHNAGYGDEIVAVCRFAHHKRQHLMVEAMRHVRTPVRLRLCGARTEYSDEIAASAARLGRGNVSLELDWISEEAKAQRLARALAVAYLPLDEDSYGYPVLEGAHASKASIVPADGGGTLEFVRDGEDGLVVEPNPQAIAQAFDTLWNDRALARRLGESARARIDTLGISWDVVVRRLLA